MQIQDNVRTPPILRMSKDVLQQIHDFIGQHRAERGGMLGRRADGQVAHFEPDRNGRCSAGAYDPDIESLNRVIKRWKAEGIEFCGFAHSHPAGVLRPSGYDEWYAGQILTCFKKLELLWLPIIMTTADGGAFQLLPYAAIPSEVDRSKVAVVNARLRAVGAGIIHSSQHAAGHISAGSELRSSRSDPKQCTTSISLQRTARQPSSLCCTYRGNFPSLHAERLIGGDEGHVVLNPTPVEEITAHANAIAKRDEFLTRAGSACDVDLLDATRLVVIGLGGAASLVRNCARMGFGEAVLIDCDQIAATNIFSQQAQPEAIGRSKAEALAEDVVRLNPAAAALAIAEPIEAIDDPTFARLLSQPFRAHSPRGDAGTGVSPRQSILLVLTDSFEANARGHRLGLHFGLPTVCAQEYVEGRGAEVTYTVPGVTPACHRCITSSRYAAYDNGYRNTVTSTGAPIFAAEMLNAILGHVLLAVAHHGTEHPRWGKVVTMLGARNLLRIRMDPDFDAHFGNTFARRIAGAAAADSFVMLDTLFLPQTPDKGQSPKRPVCPDCSGSGDLRLARGTFEDTRRIRPPRQRSA